MFVWKLGMVNYFKFAHYHSNMIDERDEIGESCDANTELTN